ncbi:MAG: ABC transporter ATP-binding protein [Armatimonadetes bacterium]|nr:ABC transporter ATP-binding protein [Armatimonadota bacterium]
MIRVENVTITYDELVAVRDLSLEVGKGSIFGLVGPNGAGKTSLIRALAGLLAPAGGRCLIDGVDVGEDPAAVHRLIGYMPDFYGVYDHLLVREYVRFFGETYGLTDGRLRARTDEVLALTRLTEKADTAVGGLSRGMKQRLCFARCLVHEPKVLLLDEPASGIDPGGRYELRKLIAHLGATGTTVFVSSHILPELADVCDSVGIMERGELRACGSVEEIAALAGAARVATITVLDGQAERARELLAGFEPVGEVTVRDDALEVRLTDSNDAFADMLALLVGQGIRIGGVTEQKSDLEQLYLKLTRGELA